MGLLPFPINYNYTKGAVKISTYTITWGNRKTNINGLPDKQVRYWDTDIQIKFYHRGKRSYPTVTKTGKFKAPREETQLYINGKYFLQFSWNLTPDNESKITEMIQYLYCFGCDLDEIKRLLKASFYQK